MLSRTRVLTLKAHKKKNLSAAARRCENVPGKTSREGHLGLLRCSVKSVCPDTTSASLHHRKQILSVPRFAAIFFFPTSATVYLLGSTLPLFLQVPDIIIAVRGMITCLLWKLADCLSPVPEELPPYEGFLLKKVAQKWLRASARTARRGRLRDGPERKTRHGGVGTKKNGDALILRRLFKPVGATTLALFVSLLRRMGRSAASGRAAAG